MMRLAGRVGRWAVRCAEMHALRAAGRGMHSRSAVVATVAAATTIAAASTEPQQPDPLRAARSALKAALQERGSVGAVGLADLTLKAGRVCARVTLPDADGLLDALIPILRAYPRLEWRADAHAGYGGGSVQLRPDGAELGAPSVSIFVPQIARSERGGAAELELVCPPNGLARREVALLAEVLGAVHRARGRPGGSPLRGEWWSGLMPPQGRHDGGGGAPPDRSSSSDPISQLEALGVTVHGSRPEKIAEGSRPEESAEEEWSALAGSENIRARIEENLLLPLRSPDVYADVMSGTRKGALLE